MWNPNDNKQKVREQAELDNCECSSGLEHFNQNNKQKINSSNLQAEDNDKKFLELSAETTDSGFISGPQTSSSIYLETTNESESVDGPSGGGDIKKLNTTVPKIQKQQHSLPNLDSGILEEEFDDDSCVLEEKEKTIVTRTEEQSEMLLPKNVESGIAEWFCNLSLNNNYTTGNINNLALASNARTNPTKVVAGTGLNNLNASKSEECTESAPPHVHKSSTTPASSISDATVMAAQQQTDTIPEQITPSNSWEKFYQQNDDGDTALHLACIDGCVDAVAALIRMSPHPCLFNIRNDDAQTPLHLATLTAQPKIIRMLLIAGAEPTLRDRHGNTALHLACISGDEQCVRALIIPISASEVHEAHRQYGHRANNKSYLKCAQLPSDLEIRNYDGERCVHIAAQAGFINILRILVLYGADINAREGKSGVTPLHIAIESCNEDLVNYLLDDCQKLNLETPTYAGLTAYQFACISNKSELQTILEKRGAEPLSPPDSDYDSSDSDFDDSMSHRFGDPGYFVGTQHGNAMPVS